MGNSANAVAGVEVSTDHWIDGNAFRLRSALQIIPRSTARTSPTSAAGKGRSGARGWRRAQGVSGLGGIGPSGAACLILKRFAEGHQSESQGTGSS